MAMGSMMRVVEVVMVIAVEAEETADAAATIHPLASSSRAI